MKVTAIIAMFVSCAALSGCVTYGQTHALITPIGVAGVHSFKPSDSTPRNINLPKPSQPDQIAANGNEQQLKDREP